MNRKLNNSLVAILASALLLAGVVLAASPAGRDWTASAPGASANADDVVEASPGNAARRGLALPYFSFARGVRRIGG